MLIIRMTICNVIDNAIYNLIDEYSFQNFLYFLLKNPFLIIEVGPQIVETRDRPPALFILLKNLCPSLDYSRTTYMYAFFFKATYMYAYAPKS
jgi:hypothetical protein